MTPERAKLLLKHASENYDSFPYSYLRSFVASTSKLYEYGITREEDAFIKKVWDTMPGYTCFFQAVERIAYPDKE